MGEIFIHIYLPRYTVWIYRGSPGQKKKNKYDVREKEKEEKSGRRIRDIPNTRQLQLSREKFHR